MPDIGLGGHKCYRHLVADFAAAQIGIHDESIFVSGAEAGSALNSTHDYRAWMLGEIVPFVMRFHRVIDIADRVGKAAMRAQSLDFLKGQLGSGRDHQIVITNQFAVVKLELVLVGMQALYPDRYKVDALALQIGAHRNFGIFALAPLHAHPRIGRCKLKILAVRNERHLVSATDFFLHLVGSRHAADSRTHDYNMRHVSSWLIEWFEITF